MKNVCFERSALYVQVCVLSLGMSVFLFSAMPVFAQDAVTTDAPIDAQQESALLEFDPVLDTTSEPIDLLAAEDVAVSAADLGAGEPTLLPDSPFYFFKEWGRGISSFFTFDPVKKMEKKLEQANERILEAKVLSEKTSNPDVIKTAIEKFQSDLDAIRTRAEGLADDNADLNSFADKFADRQIKVQKILDGMGANLPEDVQAKIEEAKGTSFENIGKLLDKVEKDSDKLSDRIEKILDDQKGSEFKNFKNLEVLKKLEEKVPEQAKEAILRAQENATKRLHDYLSDEDTQKKERFKSYVAGLPGDDIAQMKGLDDLLGADVAGTSVSDIKDLLEQKKKDFAKRLEAVSDADLEDQLLSNLKDGEVATLRIIERLHDENVSDELKSKIDEYRVEAANKLAEKISKDSEKALGALQLRGDVRDFEMIDSLEQSGDIDAELAKKLREKAQKGLKEAFDRLPDSEDARVRFAERMSAGDVGGVDGLKNALEHASAQAAPILQRVLNKQVEQLKTRLEDTRNPEEFEKLRDRVLSNDTAQKELLKQDYRVLRDIEDRAKKLINEKDAREQLKPLLEQARENIKDELENVREASKQILEQQREKLQQEVEMKREEDKQRMEDSNDSTSSVKPLLPKPVLPAPVREAVKQPLPVTTEAEKKLLEQQREALKKEVENIREDLKTQAEEQKPEEPNDVEHSSVE